MIFVGQTRFSLYSPNSPAWQATKGSRFSDEQSYKEYLFSAARLEPRSDIFFSMSIPQLKAAADGHTLRHIISYSSHLPREYQSKLEQAADEHDFLLLDRCDADERPLHPSQVAKELVSNPLHASPDGLYGEYRLDDDDVLPADYFVRVAPYMHPLNSGSRISLGAGIGAIYIDGTLHYPRRVYSPMIAIGLMSICQFNSDGSLTRPKEVAHNQSDRVGTVILDSRDPGFLWIRHSEQDTLLSSRHQNDLQSIDRVRYRLSEHPPEADLAALSEYFPYVAKRVSLDPGPGALETISEFSMLPLLNSPILLSEAQITGTVKFELRIHGGPTTVDSNALLAFSFHDREGNSATYNEWGEHLRSAGVSHSRHQEIGFYRYLPTRPGARNIVVELVIPVGLTLYRVSLHRWLLRTSTLIIENATVSIRR